MKLQGSFALLTIKKHAGLLTSYTTAASLPEKLPATKVFFAIMKLPKYLDFCVFVKSTNFKKCDVIMDIAA